MNNHLNIRFFLVIYLAYCACFISANISSCLALASSSASFYSSLLAASISLFFLISSSRARFSSFFA